MKTLVAIICLTLVVGTRAMTNEQAPLTGVIHGQVLDLFGLPIENAKVEITSGSSVQPREIQTNRSGMYRLDRMPEGRFTIDVSARGFRKEKVSVSLLLGEQVQMNFGMEVGKLTDLPPITVSGTVRQANGTVMPGTTVTIISAFNQRLLMRTQTDDAGQYKIAVDNPGQYIAYAHKPDFEVRTNILVLPATLPRQSHKLNFTLSNLRLP